MRLLTIPPIFSLMLVLTPEHQLYAAYSGSIQETLLQATKQADEVFTLPFHQKADILISVVYPPLDIDLYQSQKPIEHGKMALKGKWDPDSGYALSSRAWARGLSISDVADREPGKGQSFT